MNRKREFIEEYIKLCEEFGYYVDYDWDHCQLRVHNIAVGVECYEDCVQEIKRSLGDN